MIIGLLEAAAAFVLVMLALGVAWLIVTRVFAWIAPRWAARLAEWNADTTRDILGPRPPWRR